MVLELSYLEDHLLQQYRRSAAFSFDRVAFVMSHASSHVIAGNHLIIQMLEARVARHNIPSSTFWSCNCE